MRTFATVITFALIMTMLAGLDLHAQPKKPAAATAAAKAVDPQWIWAKDSSDNQVVYFRKEFTLPKAPAKEKGGWLIATCDNDMVVYINGKQAARSSEWQAPVRSDVTALLKEGDNVIAVRGGNEGGAAGLLVKLVLKLEGGGAMTVATDKSWQISQKESAGWNGLGFAATGWTEAAGVAKLGDGPWGDVLVGQPGVATAAGAKAAPGQSTPADALQLLPGFKAERLYSVPKSQEGSWVNMCVDPKGRLIVSNQNGILYRVTVDKPAKGEVEVEPIEVRTKPGAQPIGKAHGLCYAFNSLYVVITDGGGEGNGLYRLRDTDGDDKYDEAVLLKSIAGGGEHGPHAVKLGPDGNLWVIAGNHTKLPAETTPDSPHKGWAEDHLLPRNPDGNGHATGVMAPGGWVCRIDPEGKTWHVHCGGFRNQFDIDWNLDGEMFTYDSDMEWDTGMPWYRPTRVNHNVRGAEFGWRYGTGKWPEYYPDSLPATMNIGLGSPTGVSFGTGAKFPAKYQRAFYACDWTYGKLYAVHLTPRGASYSATFEPFVTGKPFPLTDVVIGSDGAMYITIGGRGTQSGLYRVTYDGSESTAPLAKQEDPRGREARALRRQLEAFHGKKDAKAIALAWPHLNSSDRFIRYAARIAIEWQDVATWQDKALSESRPTALINAIVALARSGDKALQGKALDALAKLPLRQLDEEQMLEAMRAYQLVFIRMGSPDDATAKKVASRLAPLFPHQSSLVNRELVQVLIYLKDETVVAKAMKELAAAPTQEDQIHFLFVLRNATAGWTLDLRRGYFSAMNLASSKYKGGASFRNFFVRIRKEAVEKLSKDEQTALDKEIKGEQTVEVVKVTAPRQFVHNWQMEDILPIIDQAGSGRDFARGKAAFEAAQCSKCHRFGGEGGAAGPDITGVGSRFSAADLLESIIIPSKVISDQYADTEVFTKDGDRVVGRIEAEDDAALTLRADPLAPDVTKILKKEIESRGLSKTSKMPTALISILQKDEVLDLLAYLRSGGNANDAAFKK